MKAVWRIMKLIVAVIFFFGMIVMGYTVYQIAHYQKEKPVINVGEQLVFPPNSEIKCSEIADAENSQGEEITGVQWSDGGYDKLTLMSDGSSVIVGNRTGKLNVTVKAKGHNRDVSCEIQLTIE